MYVRVRSHLDALLLPKSVYRAQDGANGKGKCQHGRGGTDLFIDVPLGTLVYELIDHGSVDSSRNARELKESFDEQMYQHMGKQYDEIKGESLPESEEEVTKTLLFDSSYLKDNDVFCVAIMTGTNAASTRIYVTGEATETVACKPPTTRYIHIRMRT